MYVLVSRIGQQVFVILQTERDHSNIIEFLNHNGNHDRTFTISHGSSGGNDRWLGHNFKQSSLAIGCQSTGTSNHSPVIVSIHSGSYTGEIQGCSGCTGIHGIVDHIGIAEPTVGADLPLVSCSIGGSNCEGSSKPVIGKGISRLQCDRGRDAGKTNTAIGEGGGDQVGVDVTVFCITRCG